MGDSQKTWNPDYHCFDTMTTAQLEELLRADLDCPQEDALDPETILYILDVLERRKGDDPQGEETAREKLAQCRALYLPCDDPASLYAWEESEAVPPAEAPRRRPRLRVMRRLGLVAAVISILFATLLAAQAAGLDLWGVIVRWSDETFHFSYQGEGPSSSWMNGQEELEMNEYLPRWIPEGYAVEEIQTHELSDRSTAIITFSGENLPTFYLSVDVYEGLEQMQYMIFEKDDTPVQERHLANGETVYFYENCGYKKSVYQHRNIICSISGDITQETAMKIYESTEGGM
ncbi:DUF4367 domain-containing protein [Pseudoflavonifractor sp. SW1122]|uniref:DUF4367 domain-containing protein n=1 Tax=Pseudoflavonifractor sp. SW1122 TaxID=2530044 RepID=UPI00143BA1AC|nr:DUF4367 domain-containing protein [Pseudoflavonifractor sp. SW1122]NJE74155.1 DUF4367 domain-containing protein [Pseudoflavonifractor sp. SW1122]